MVDWQKECCCTVWNGLVGQAVAVDEDRGGPSLAEVDGGCTKCSTSAVQDGSFLSMVGMAALCATCSSKLIGMLLVTVGCVHKHTALSQEQSPLGLVGLTIVMVQVSDTAQHRQSPWV